MRRVALGAVIVSMICLVAFIVSGAFAARVDAKDSTWDLSCAGSTTSSMSPIACACGASIS